MKELSVPYSLNIIVFPKILQQPQLTPLKNIIMQNVLNYKSYENNNPDIPNIKFMIP